MNHEELLRIALEQGASKAAIIPESKIITSPTFRDVCVSNGCGRWNRNWMCSPAIGDIHDLIAKVHSFTHGLLYQTISDIEDSFDIEGMTEAGDRHKQLSFRLRALLDPMIEGERLHLGSGGCFLCERCTILDNEPCRHPDQTMLSLESCGIDVYNTTRTTDLKYINGPDTVTFFGLILWREESGATL